MRRIALAIGTTILAGGMIAWFEGGYRTTDRVGREPNDSVRGAEMMPTGTRVVRGSGYVEPASEIRRLVFKVDGVIEHCAVHVGQRVEKGMMLISLNDDDQQAAVAEAEVYLALAIAERDQLFAGAHPDQIAAMQRKLELLEERLRFAHTHHERIEKLAHKNATSMQDLDRAATDLRQAERSLSLGLAELDNLENYVRPVDRQVAEAKVRLADSRLATARQKLACMRLTAPFSGTVLEILRREGEGARLSGREPVLIFADESNLRIRAEIDERYVHQLAIGQVVEVNCRGLGKVNYRGKIALVKSMMGNKTVFTREATERKDLDMIEVLVDMPADFKAPLALQVNVDIQI